MKVIAHLNGKVSANVTNVVRESGNVLGALVGDTGNTVVVHQESGGVGRVIRRERRVGDGAIGDPAHRGEKVTTSALYLLRRGARTANNVPGNANQGRGADGYGGDCP
jgi:glutamine amidotransferase-like uncharacterized protein